MNNSISHVFSLLLLLSALCCISACESTPQRAQHTQPSAVELENYASKQQQYDQLLDEWQTLKPGLKRLLAIEEELNLLMGQLEQLSASLDESQSNTQVVSTFPEPARAPAVAIKPFVATTPTAQPSIETQPSVAETITRKAVSDVVQTAPEITPTAPEVVQTAANFALQVAAITDIRQLPNIWQGLVKKYPNVLADLTPNFQKTNVHNTDYYRLKLGAFNTQTEASTKCADLKAAGVTCLVVNYTGSNFAQLTN